jgi:ubiquinol-cytochrome c reductase iron-sulfur subunit
VSDVSDVSDATTTDVTGEVVAGAVGHGGGGGGSHGGGPDSNGGVTHFASLDDPHLQPFAKNPRRAEAVIALVLIVALAAFCGYGALYWVGGQTQWEGVFMGAGLFLFGFGMSAYGKYLLPQGPFEEERHPHESTPEEQELMTAAIYERGQMIFRRRGFLGAVLGAGGAVMGVVLGFPLLRSLGPVPKSSMYHTDWKQGALLVDINGNPVTNTTLEKGGLLTVFPQGFENNPDAQAIDQTLIIRLDGFSPTGAPPPAIVTRPGRETWGPQGMVAYSKVCTHAGCPVGLYQEQTEQLLCPCHQSLFDVRFGAQQVFGPAPRPLPQLPIYIDDEGMVRAQSDYHEAIGPGFWERTTG